ncbi:MAG: hypothetical protein A2900_05545 [Candidatus Chisholmbacteria bacterium RIFCSPLOWO2_01_FULL_50_28]|uniref:Uncharacterized protein n=1 Tax=Candidatus Chisholmbacteria bacterium RIFCSPHIGHO2_01_FULL_52_32 TaxID=1797591 RepID=A0A1G1VRV4_9BACT|nr:MAG: hypothetical protein A2786_01200 [Candidatus Chisholmbacteria bacterium RIFCSPHIGHO2_01_FULL_52_32]OGY20508.1 MAG: hypothetical protein A2900_05545 [Candidatus Chisholmbacteria bacterium RIFCSPLOWO2_01_FULL_50_28]
MPTVESGRIISDPQELDRLASTLLQMFAEGRDEAEVERWLQINIPDEIQRYLITINAITTALNNILPQMDAAGKLETEDLDLIEKWQAEARQRLDEINAYLGQEH